MGGVGKESWELMYHEIPVSTDCHDVCESENNHSEKQEVTSLFSALLEDKDV